MQPATRIYLVYPTAADLDSDDGTLLAAGDALDTAIAAAHDGSIICSYRLDGESLVDERIEWPN